MTIWNDIYKNFKKGWNAWATLSEDIHPMFLDFLNKSQLKYKCVFDVWCWTWKYLEFLQSKWFITDGIDSSEIAIKMTKKVLKSNSMVVCKNMFEFDIPVNKNDCTLS